MHQEIEHRGTIWIVWGETPQTLKKEEYKGKRSVRALKPFCQRLRKGNSNLKGPDKNFVYLQYEDDMNPLSDVKIGDLYQMGVITENVTTKSFQKIHALTKGEKYKY